MKTENCKTSKTSLIVEDIVRFECGICMCVLYNATSCDPCLHSFCAGCIGQWFKINKYCPMCTVESWELLPNRYIDKLIKKFVKQNPELERCSEDKIRLDKMKREYLNSALTENQWEVSHFSGNDEDESEFVDLKRKCVEEGQRISRRLWKPKVYESKKSRRNEISCVDDKTHDRTRVFVANIVTNIVFGAFLLIPLMAMVCLVSLSPWFSYALFLFIIVCL